KVFREKIKMRQHKRSYDFYLDGITLEPLPRIFYSSFYRSKYVNEDETYISTTNKGETYIRKPFGPDLVHTPPDKEIVKSKIYSVKEQSRDLFAIPSGLESVDDLTFSKLTIQLLIGCA